MQNLILQGRIRNKLVTEIRMVINVERFFLPKLCGRSFYHEFKKLLSEASINTDHEQDKPKRPI